MKRTSVAVDVAEEVNVNFGGLGLRKNKKKGSREALYW